MRKADQLASACLALVFGFAAAACFAKDVSLVVNNGTVHDAIGILQRESGYKVQHYGGMGGDGRRLTLDLRNVPFFRALHELAKAAGLNYDSWQPGVFTLMAGRPKDPPIFIDGPFRFAILNISRDLDLTYGLKTEPTLKVSIELMWEPEVSVISSNDAVNVSAAKTAAGETLTVVPTYADSVRSRMYSSSYYGSSYPKRQFWTQLKPPDEAHGELAELRGYVTLTTAERMDEVAFENPLAAQQVKRMAGDTEITLVSFTEERGYYTAVFAVPIPTSSDPRGGNTSSSIQARREFILVDDAKQQHRPQDFSSMGTYRSSYRTYQVNIRFGDLPPGRKPAALLCRYPASQRELDIGFEFKNLPLP